MMITLKENHHQRGRELAGDIEPVKNHTEAAPPRERQEAARHDFGVVRAAYEKATGNQIGDVPLHRILSVLESVPRRTPAKINSFNYFIKEIVASQDPRNRAWQQKQLEKIVRLVRNEIFDLPVAADLRVANRSGA
jgi:hypothetical protein